MAFPLIPLLIIAGSALVKHQANQQALNRQKRLQSAMDAYQRGKSRESMAATEKLLEKQTPDARGAELAEVTASREQSLRDTVGAAQAFDAPALAGKTNADYERAQEAQANTIAARTKRAIEQLATMGAPGEQKLKHQLRFGRAAGVVDASNAASDSVGQAYRTDISNVRPDPFLSLVSDIGMGVGSGMAMGGFGAAASAAPTAAEGAAIADGMSSAAGVGASGPSVAAPLVRRKLANAFSLFGRA